MHLLVMYSPHTPSEEHIRRLQSEDGVSKVTVASDEETAVEAAPDVEVILGHRYLRQALSTAEKLQWVQSTTQGTDRLPCDEMARQGVRLTRYTGSASVVARHALALAWAVTRRVPTAVQQQAAGQWAKDMEYPPLPEQAIVFGTGPVGRSLAQRLQGQGLSVTGVKRTLDGSLPGFDLLYDRHGWRGNLDRFDWCFLALPNTDETQGLIDSQVLQTLPTHAVVVNVGRGEVLDLDALTTQLHQGQLAGAALDVLPQRLEPLPSSHPLWEVPHLLLTPHVASYHPERRHNVEQFCENQLHRYLAGDPLKHEVELSISSSQD